MKVEPGNKVHHQALLEPYNYNYPEGPNTQIAGIKFHTYSELGNLNPFPTIGYLGTWTVRATVDLLLRFRAYGFVLYFFSWLQATYLTGFLLLISL